MVPLYLYSHLYSDKRLYYTCTAESRPVDMARFIQSYETETGDYTKERHEWLPDDPDTVKGRLPGRQKTRKMKKPHPWTDPFNRQAICADKRLCQRA